MTTCEPLPDGGKDGQPLTLFAADSLAKTSVTLDVVPGLKASTADYGLTSPRSFARYDLATSSWKTRQGCLSGEWAEWSATWPQAGTTRNGTAYRRRPSVPRTYERESGYWPTPVASETQRTTPYKQGGHSLSYVLGGSPNPPWTEWLMGYPTGWTDFADSETPLSPRSPSTSDE
jgi:hypothetical protein